MTQLNQSAWHWLTRELDRWDANGKRAHFWWRDDDATTPSAQLDQLASLSHALRAPVALAVIPAQAEPTLAEYLSDFPLISVLQHGYAHKNHALPGQRKLELGGQLDHKSLITDLKSGMQLLDGQFDGRFIRVLVPPWNRIDDSIVDQLNAIGFIGISTMKVRHEAYPKPGLYRVNTHLDPVNWRHGSGFIGLYPAIAILLQHLIAKRTGYRDSEEPTGLLSHHLVQNAATWRFIEQLLKLLGAHPAVSWCDAREIWR